MDSLLITHNLAEDSILFQNLLEKMESTNSLKNQNLSSNKFRENQQKGGSKKQLCRIKLSDLECETKNMNILKDITNSKLLEKILNSSTRNHRNSSQNGRGEDDSLDFDNEANKREKEVKKQKAIEHKHKEKKCLMNENFSFFNPSSLCSQSRNSHKQHNSNLSSDNNTIQSQSSLSSAQGNNTRNSRISRNTLSNNTSNSIRHKPPSGVSIQLLFTYYLFVFRDHLK